MLKRITFILIGILFLAIPQLALAVEASTRLKVQEQESASSNLHSEVLSGEQLARIKKAQSAFVEIDKIY